MLYSVVTTFGHEQDAKRIVSLLLPSHTAACCQIEVIHSMFFFEGQYCEEKEYRLTVICSLEVLERCLELIKKEHPYQIPKLIWWPIQASTEYTGWVSHQCLDAEDYQS